MVVAAYALLWTAALRMNASRPTHAALSPPKWRSRLKTPGALPSTSDLLRVFRAEIWSRAIRPAAFWAFASGPPADTKCQKPSPSLTGALFATAA